MAHHWRGYVIREEFVSLLFLDNGVKIHLAGDTQSLMLIIQWGKIIWWFKRKWKLWGNILSKIKWISRTKEKEGISISKGIREKIDEGYKLVLGYRYINEKIVGSVNKK